VGLAVELDEFLEHHRAGRHVDAQGQGLGGEADLQQPAGEQLLDDVPEGRQHAGVVRAVAVAQGPSPLPEPEDPEVLGRDPLDPPVDGREDLVAFGVGGQPHPVDEELTDRAVATGAGEDEVDRREHRGTAHLGDDVGAFRPLPPSGLLRPGGRGDDGAVDVGVTVRRACPVERHDLGADHHRLVQRDRTVGGDDQVGASAHRGEPGAELLGVAHRR
jgi:hypothetical protein